MGGWTGMGGEVVSFWDAGLRTGWAARGGGYRGTRGGQAGQPIDEVSRKEEEFQKKKKKKVAELMMAAAAMHARGPGFTRHVYFPDTCLQ